MMEVELWQAAVLVISLLVVFNVMCYNKGLIVLL